MKASKTVDLELKQIIEGSHPPVIRRYALGENAPAFKAGQIVGITAGGIIAYADIETTETVTVGEGASAIEVDVPVTPRLGVVTASVEANSEGLNVLVHGTVVKESLIKAADTAADATALAQLEACGIWAV